MSNGKLIPVMALFFPACATTPPGMDLEPVPVYPEEEAPCEYEVLERVRVRSPTTATSEEDFLRRLREAYGRAGAAVGADAVIVDIPEPRGVARRRERGWPPSPSLGPPTGRAVRFVPGTCGGAGGRTQVVRVP